MDLTTSTTTSRTTTTITTPAALLPVPTKTGHAIQPDHEDSGIRDDQNNNDNEEDSSMIALRTAVTTAGDIGGTPNLSFSDTKDYKRAAVETETEDTIGLHGNGNASGSHDDVDDDDEEEDDDPLMIPPLAAPFTDVAGVNPGLSLDKDIKKSASSKAKHMRSNGIPLFLDTDEKLRVAQVYIKLLIACNEKAKDQKGSGTRANQLGSGGVSCRMLAKEACVGKTTAAKIIKELKEHGGILIRKNPHVLGGPGSLKLSPEDRQVLAQLFVQHLAEESNNNNSVAARSTNKKSKKALIHWFQQELHQRTGTQTSYSIMYNYVLALQKEHTKAVGERERAAAFLGLPSSPPVDRATLENTSGVLFPSFFRDSACPVVPFPDISLRDTQNTDEGDNPENEQDPYTLQQPMGEGEMVLQELTPPPPLPPPTKAKIANAKDLAASAYNALHHEDVEVAVQRLHQALCELGRR